MNWHISKATLEGRNFARTISGKASMNPYKLSTKEYDDWLSGFNDARDMLGLETKLWRESFDALTREQSLINP